MSASHNSLEETATTETTSRPQETSQGELTSNVILELQSLNLKPNMKVLSSADKSDPSTTGVDLEEFHYFPKLPVELRLQIWKSTFPPGAEVVHLSPTTTHRKDTEEGTLCWSRRSRKPQIPMALYINAESRQEALKTYELCFPNHNARKFYVDFSEAIFWICGDNGHIGIPKISSEPKNSWRGDETFINTASAENYNKIQRLIISSQAFRTLFAAEGTHWYNEGSTPLIGLPAHLKELIVTEYVERGDAMRDFIRVFKVYEDRKPEEGEDDERKLHRGITDRSKTKMRETFKTAKEENPDWNAPWILRFGYFLQ